MPGAVHGLVGAAVKEALGDGFIIMVCKKESIHVPFCAKSFTI